MFQAAGRGARCQISSLPRSPGPTAREKAPVREHFYSNVSKTISEWVPTRIGGPHVPAPLDVYTRNAPKE